MTSRWGHVRLAALAGAVATASGCSFIGLPARLGPDTTGWSSEPTPASPILRVEAERLCWEATGDGLEPITVIQDQRGPDVAAFLFVGANDSVTCVVFRGPDRLFRAQGLTYVGSLLPSGVEVAVSGIDCGPPTTLEGTVPEGTETLTVVTQVGLRVTASVADGRFLAWWPGRDNPVALISEVGSIELTERVC
jgi:hypothetical protein